MKCNICRSSFSESPTTISFRNRSDKYLNQEFDVCLKCAYSILQRAVEIDPTNRIYQEPKNYDEVVKREG
jgi:hypothetical protein